MEHSDEILNELKLISPFLSGVKRINVFSVPQGYFTHLDKQILENILIQPSYLLTSETQNLDVPAGYFENLAGDILKKIKNLPFKETGDELINFPVLSTLQKKNVFTVPENYFQQLPISVLAGLKPTEAKVISIKKRRLWNYAVAAAVTGLMAISSLLVVQQNHQFTAGRQVSINKSFPAYIKDSYQYKNEEQINEGITKLSDDDIIKYLESTGNDSDNEAFASGVKEKELPAEKDYLLNEKTLDVYLNQN